MAKNYQKRREQRKKKLRSLILLLFLTVVMLSTATYAWFTANKSVSIDPIDVHVAASSGLQISVNANEWKTVISNSDIANPGINDWAHTNMLPYELTPVSTDGTVTSGKLVFYHGVVEGNANDGGAMSLTTTGPITEAQYVYTLNAQSERVYPTEQGTIKADFVAFDMFLKNDDTSNVDVYLTAGSGVTITDGTTGADGLQNAARYAFVQEGTGPSTTAEATVRGWTGGTGAIIVEPNYDLHTDVAVTTADQYYKLTTTANTANTAPVPYYGVISESGPTRLLNTNPGTGNATSSSDFASVTSTGGIRYTNTAYSTSTAASHADIRSIQGETTTNGTYHKIFTLAPGVTKFRVYMWVEGQDVDCENNASNAYLRFNIGLSLLDGSSSGTTQP